MHYSSTDRVHVELRLQRQDSTCINYVQIHALNVLLYGKEVVTMRWSSNEPRVLCTIHVLICRSSNSCRKDCNNYLKHLT